MRRNAGQLRPKGKRVKPLISKPIEKQPEPEEVKIPEPAIVPVNLLAALEKMRGSGSVPVFITKELEKFLTEQGVYRDDMRPAEAWEKLNQIAGNQPEPEPPAAS